MTAASRQSYAFTLTLAGAAEITETIEDAIFEAGCDDALLWSRGGVVYLNFDREAATFEDAVASARADVARAGVGLSVSGVSSDTESPAGTPQP